MFVTHNPGKPTRILPGALAFQLRISALAHVGLARAYAIQSDTAKAAYQDFLTLWKDADPDVPILIAAKAECAKLKWLSDLLEKNGKFD